MDICYQNFPNICRICLHSGDLHNFFQFKVINLYNSILNIEVNESDLLPKNVCKTCLKQLEEVSLFIDKCKTNNLLLRKICLSIQKGNDSDEFDNETSYDANCDVEQNESTPFKTKLANSLANKDDIDLSSGLLRNNNSYNSKRNCFNCKEDISRGGLKKHYSLNTKCRPKDCTCPICGKSFYPKYKLVMHVRSHKKNTSYKCPECAKSFVFAENFRKHVLTHQGVKPFICEICEKGFLRKRSLDEHMNFHTGKTPYVCVYCGKGFKRLTDHAAHIYHIHSANVEKIPKHKRKYTEKRVHLSLECKICGKVFASRSGFANHQLIHEGVKKFLCNICGRKFITNPILQSHMRTHTGEKPFQCKECGKYFRQRNSLKTHLSLHVTDKSLKCPNCDKRYHTKIGLNNHLITHADEKPLECSQCNKRFHLKYALHNHVLNHRMEKPHKCNLCDKLFASPSHLKVHLRTHSGEKPYPCNICGKQLAQPQTLKVHMRQHTGETPYVCSVCDKGFHDSSNLKRHFNRHHSGDRNINKSSIAKHDEGV